MPELLHFPTPPAKPAGPADAAVRAEALDIRRSFIVEAPAGSGKTGLLVQRFLKLLGDPEVELPEEVLAMTFTRKATAEMQQRVLKELRAALEGTSPRDDFERQTRDLAAAVLLRHDPSGKPWEILSKPQRLNIRSILSVCMDLSHAQPLLSGSGTQQPVEDPSPLHRLAARSTFLALGGSDLTLNDALKTVLLHRDGNLANCEALVASMLHTREQWGELIPLDATLDGHLLDNVVRPRLEVTLETIVCNGLSRALTMVPAHLLQEATALAARIGAAPPYKDNKPTLSLCADRHESPEATADHLDHWRAIIDMLLTREDGWRKSANRGHLGHDFDNKKEGTALNRLLAEMSAHPGADDILAALCAVRSLPPSRYPDEQWAVARSLFIVLRRALVELKLLFAARGECDFPELALGARAVLSSTSLDHDTESDTTSSRALAFGGRLRHLLVDEMQDTSSAQYELIELLTSSWDGHSQTLFLVGDPKQSIYLFRQARVERFLRTLRERRIGSGQKSVPLTPLQLTANFRSQQRLVHDFNDTFRSIFPAAEPAAEQDFDAVHVPFVEAAPIRPSTSSTGILWHPTVLSSRTPDATEPDPAATEAREIVQLIRQRLDLTLPPERRATSDREAAPWRIAVLARSRNHLSAVVAELKRQSIPFRAVDLDPLDERPEVLDALALTRALLHPADRVAWLAVLRAPWCGLDRADLLALTGEGPSAEPEATLAMLVARHRARLSPAGRQMLHRAWPILETSVATLGAAPLSVHVERTWRSLGGDVCLSPVERSNVHRFLSLLREIEAQPEAFDLTRLAARLQNLYAEPLSGPNIHVDLQTIHSAKGLEWDVVFVPGLHRRPRGSSAGLLNWLELDGLSATPQSPHETTIVLAPIWGKGHDSDKLNDWLKDIRTRRELAEIKRLFYVASTRAREELHLFAALPLDSKGELAKPISSSLLKACWEAAAPSFAALTSNVISIDDDLNFIPHDEEETFALAASIETIAVTPPPLIRRLPLDFNPSARFTEAAARKLPYAAAAALPQARPFDRPDGSFAVRAFGNVVHRYLQLLADRLTLTDAATLATELASWQPRLEASLRGEGLPPRDAARESTRALAALTRTLADPTGLWLLSPHAQAASESALTAVGPTPLGLRVDRTFLAGQQPLDLGDNTLWIIDFKTTDQGSLPDAAFAALQRSRYSAQLETYAAIRRKLPSGHLPIHLGLYFPLASKLIHWPAGNIPAGDTLDT